MTIIGLSEVVLQKTPNTPCQVLIHLADDEYGHVDR